MSDLDLAQALYGSAPVAPAASPAPPASAPDAKSGAYTLYCQPVTADPAPSPAPAPAAPPPAPEPQADPTGIDDADQNARPAADNVRGAEVEALARLTPDAVRAAIPAAIVEARAADTARHLFGDQERDALASSLALDDVPGMQPETVAAVRKELANMALDAGATHADLDVLSAALAEAQAGPLTNEQRIASRDQCITAYNEAYGQEATRTLQITRAWLASDPRRAAIFEAAGGDNPKVAMLAARLALAAQRSGRR